MWKALHLQLEETTSWIMEVLVNVHACAGTVRDQTHPRSHGQRTRTHTRISNASNKSSTDRKKKKLVEISCSKYLSGDTFCRCFPEFKIGFLCKTEALKTLITPFHRARSPSLSVRRFVLNPLEQLLCG